jgi:methyl-accepting chemotaxis protein
VTPLTVSQEFLSALNTSASAGTFQYTRNDQNEYASVTKLGTTGWSLVTNQPAVAIFAPVNQQTQTFLLLGLLFAVIAAAFAFITARQITRPIGQMERTALQISAGDYSRRMPETGADQLTSLGRTVNVMVDQIVTNSREQEAQNAALQTQIMQLLEEVSTVAEGDLTVEAEVTDNALGAVADSFNYMITELRQVIGRVNMATHQVSNSTDEILTTTDNLSRSAEQQASRIADTSTAIEEMAVSIQQVSENAAVSAQVAREAREAATAGSQAVTATVEGMVRIRQQVQETSKKIKRLGESSQEIGQAVQLIEEIAKRTNRLALNAAIQAAMVRGRRRGGSPTRRADQRRDRADRRTRWRDSVRDGRCRRRDGRWDARGGRRVSASGRGRSQPRLDRSYRWSTGGINRGDQPCRRSAGTGLRRDCPRDERTLQRDAGDGRRQPASRRLGGVAGDPRRRPARECRHLPPRY